MEDLIAWFERGCTIIVGIAAVVYAFDRIVNGGGRFGNWFRRVVAGDVRDDMARFMSEHEGCKPKTEKRLEKLESRIGKCEELLGRDWNSIRLLLRITDAHGEHIIHGNHMEQVRQLKDEQHEHLLNK